MKATLQQYSHALIFNIEGECSIFMTLTRDQAEPLSPLDGMITQPGYEPYAFTFTGPIKIPVLIEVLKMFEAQRVETDQTTCDHVFEFSPEYCGSYPQPKRCLRCGALDLNGYRGELL